MLQQVAGDTAARIWRQMTEQLQTPKLAAHTCVHIDQSSDHMHNPCMQGDVSDLGL